MTTIQIDHLIYTLFVSALLFGGAGKALHVAHFVRATNPSAPAPITQRKRYVATTFAAITALLAIALPYLLGHDYGQIMFVLERLRTVSFVFGWALTISYIGSFIVLVLAPFVAFFSVYRHPAAHAYRVNDNSYLLTDEMRTFRADPESAPVPQPIAWR